MSTKSIQQLQKELKEAEQALLTESNEKLLAEFKAALDNKYFLLQWQWKDGQAVAVARYSEFKYRSNPQNDDIPIEYKTEIATVQLTRSRKTRSLNEPTGVTRHCNQYNSSRHLFHVTNHHVKEITKAQFDTIWGIPLMMADIQIPKWLEITASELKENLYQERPQSPDVVVDAPFVTLEPWEVSFVHGSPFLLPNNRHLITANATSFVSDRIYQEEALERRTAHLTEECDRMYYLEGKRKTILALKTKFKL